MNLGKYNLHYDKSIKNWDEGIPLGNGKIGCLIYGDGPLRISLDRVDLWDLRDHPDTLRKDFNYQNLVNLSKSADENDWKERVRRFESIYSDPYPSKITAGRIELDFGKTDEDTVSELDIQSAVATVKSEDMLAEFFAHATRFIGVAKIKGDYTVSLHIPVYIGSSGLCYPDAERVEDGNFIYYVQRTATDLQYGIFMLKVPRDNCSELYFTIANNSDCADYVEETKRLLSDASKTGYERLKEEHIDWWKNYWNKSCIDLNDEMIEKVYYRSYYLFGSCSREGFYPMPLQGVWTADNDKLPPWKGDYHHDTNTQLSYQSYLKGNHLEEGRVFIDYLWSMKAQFEKYAKEFYGVDGLIVPGVSTLDGKQMGGWAQYSYSPTMSIWSAQSFDEYYLYTADEEFLRDRAYPFFAEIGEALLGILEEKDGKLYLPLSSSPEIHDNERSAYLIPNSNFDLALMRYLFRTLAGYCEKLGIDGEKYRSALEKLDDIHIIDGKYIGLDRNERLRESHRHFSHLMCMYPLHLINYDTEEHKRLYENSLSEIESLGTSGWVGFSFPMCAQIYAMAEDGDNAYRKLWIFSDGFVEENGFHLNGDFKNKGYSSWHYRPFTLEALFGYCDAVQEMLLQEHMGYIHLFPAIPKKWRKGKISFSGLRSYGGVLIDAQMQDGVLTCAVLRSEKPKKVLFKNVFDTETLTLKYSDGRTETKHCKCKETLEISFDTVISITA